MRSGFQSDPVSQPLKRCRSVPPDAAQYGPNPIRPQSPDGTHRHHGGVVEDGQGFHNPFPVAGMPGKGVVGAVKFRAEASPRYTFMTA